MSDKQQRLCRTVDEAWAAGQEDARGDRPLSPVEINRLAKLLRPYLHPQANRKTA